MIKYVLCPRVSMVGVNKFGSDLLRIVWPEAESEYVGVGYIKTSLLRGAIKKCHKK